MRPRDLLLICTAALLASLVAIPLLGRPAAAGELLQQQPAPAEPEVESTPAPAVVDGGPAQPLLAATAEPTFRKSDPVATTGWTSGVIRGDIALASSVLDQLQTLQVVVDEMRPLDNKDGKRPFRLVQKVERGPGTPSFEVRNVPFSPYGYVVSAYAPGLNGNQQTVEITEEHPLADEVRLAITPGAPFSLLLRDQENGALAGVEVRMVPTGAPLGRPHQNKVTDNFGSAVFENMLAGDYQVLVGPAGAPLAPAQTVTVQSVGHTLRNGVPQPQGATLTVPTGVTVEIAVTDGYGGPLEGALVRMQATDKRVLTLQEGVTDVRGQVRFPHVPQGQWQIDVAKQDFDRRTSQIAIDGRTAPAVQQFALPRLR